LLNSAKTNQFLYYIILYYVHSSG